MSNDPTNTPIPPSTPVTITDDDVSWNKTADHHIQSETAWWPHGESTAFGRACHLERVYAERSAEATAEAAAEADSLDTERMYTEDAS